MAKMQQNPDGSRTWVGLKTDFTSEELSANGVKGGKASGVTRRKQRTFRESIKAIMALQTPDEEKRQVLEALGVDPTVLNAINLAVSGKAAAGDVEAARYLRDTFNEQRASNEKAHDEMGSALREHGERLQEHEQRITELEHRELRF